MTDWTIGRINLLNQQINQQSALNAYPMHQSDYVKWHTAVQSQFGRLHAQNQTVATLMQNALRPFPLWFWEH